MSSNDWWEYLKWASSHHLTETFPDAVLSDSETDEYEMHEERLTWIDLHVTERNENRDRDDIFDEIHVLAVSAYELVKEKLNA
jgi:hypothetical protein